MLRARVCVALKTLRHVPYFEHPEYRFLDCLPLTEGDTVFPGCVWLLLLGAPADFKASDVMMHFSGYGAYSYQSLGFLDVISEAG